MLDKVTDVIVQADNKVNATRSSSYAHKWSAFDRSSCQKNATVRFKAYKIVRG
jgi:hypothetical protein